MSEEIKENPEKKRGRPKKEVVNQQSNFDLLKEVSTKINQSIKDESTNITGR